jgi:hypothetical protein
MKKYLVPDTTNPEKLVIIGASGFVPQGVIIELPEEFYEEEAEWLVVTEEEGEFGEVVKVVSIDEQLKAQILAERQAARLAANKLEIRKQKRLFGEHMIDQISVLNEQANINEQALEVLLTDPDFTIIREHLYAGSLKSAYNKILSVEPKILMVFSQADLDAIKAKLLAKLQELGEI